MSEVIKNELKFIEKKKKVINDNKRCTHLYYQNKSLKSVPKQPVLKDVCVLYLFNNEIEVIENLNDSIFPNLRSLYLQNNKITKMDPLPFRRLRKLYIGYNKIAVIEGLEEVDSLEELHVEKQSPPDGMGLCFDPRSTLNLARTLHYLNISGNKIPSFSSLLFLVSIRTIDASNCDLEDLKEVCETIKKWKYLTEANFSGNPISKTHRYREDIIVHSFYLETLDGKDISDFSREFLKRLEPRRLILAQRSRASVNLAEMMDNLPKNYPPSLQKAASAQLIRTEKYNPLKNPISDDLEIFTWEGLPKRRPGVGKSKINSFKNMDSSITVNKFR